MVSMLHGEWALLALHTVHGITHGGIHGSIHSGAEVTGVRPTLMEATGM